MVIIKASLDLEHYNLLLRSSFNIKRIGGVVNDN